MLITPSAQAQAGVSQFQILANKQSAHTAYRTSRPKPRVVVTPQILPGPGFVIGVNYLFQAVYPEGEDLSWTVSKFSSLVPKTGELTAGTAQLLADVANTASSEIISRGTILKSGKTDTFHFCPTQEGRYTVTLNFRQDDVGFEDAVVIHANASPATNVSRHIFIALGCVAASATIVIITAVVCAVLLKTKEYAIRTETVEIGHGRPRSPRAA